VCSPFSRFVCPLPHLLQLFIRNEPLSSVDRLVVFVVVVQLGVSVCGTRSKKCGSDEFSFRSCCLAGGGVCSENEFRLPDPNKPKL
jgi:hypothetical protein